MEVDVVNLSDSDCASGANAMESSDSGSDSDSTHDSNDDEF